MLTEERLNPQEIAEIERICQIAPMERSRVDRNYLAAVAPRLLAELRELQEVLASDWVATHIRRGLLRETAHWAARSEEDKKLSEPHMKMLIACNNTCEALRQQRKE